MKLVLTICAACMVLMASAERIRFEKDAKVAREWKHLADDVQVDKIELTFAVKLRNKNELHQKLMSVSSPKSSNYGQLLTLKEVDALTSPSAESVNTVLEFLESQGVNKENISQLGGFIKAVVSVQMAEQILSTKYHTFKHEHSGDVAVRCPDGYSLDDEVAKHVDFVAPTVNFPNPFRVRSSKSATATGDEKESDLYQNTPESLRELYNVNDAMGGKSESRQAVTAFLHQYYLEEDLQSFYEDYFPELQGTPIANVIGPNFNTSGVEAALDVEYMTVMGAGVPTEFWSFAGRQPDATANEPFLDWLVLLSGTEDPPLVFSTSYGEGEETVSLDYAERMNDEFARNSLRGITFLFASGDWGVGNNCNGEAFKPNYPADSPYVTAVGATTGVGPETGAGLSSGGFSNRWEQPEWQKEAVAAFIDAAGDADQLPSAELYNAAGRAFPDIAAQGTNFVVVSGGATLPSVAGTSCSSPTFGGIVAMLNDARIAAGKSPMGFLNPFIYANPGIFNDIVSGNNPGCGTDGFTAIAGWDPVTGFGTPDYQRMLDAALALP